MILQLQDWVFEIDIAETMKYSAAEAAEHCTCGYCRNFYRGVETYYPDFRKFLAEFGADVEAPEVLMPVLPTLYMGSYLVKGRILCTGVKPMTVNHLSISAEPIDDGFLLSFGEMELPWILDEPPEDVVSPANEPDFLQKMTEKWMESREFGFIS